MLLNGFQENQMSLSMVRKEWRHIFYYLIFCPPNLRHSKIVNWDWNDSFLANIFSNLRRCRLQLDNFYVFIFISKIWPINPRNGCKPSPLTFSGVNWKLFRFEKELEEFEGSFEHNEIVDIWNLGRIFFLIYIFV